MRLCILGPVDAVAGGRRLALRSDRQRTILGILLAAGGEVVTAGRLIEGLWGDAAPAKAPAALHTHVSRLRSRLGSLDPAGRLAVGSTPEGYRIVTDACGLDAVAFEELVARARGRGLPPETVMALLDEARRLWRGDNAFGTLAHHALIRSEARRLDQLREAAATERIDAMLALGGHPDAVAELETTVRARPLDERAHGQLMLCQYRGGRQAEALATFRDLQQRLAEELGADPSRELRGLHEAILRHDAGLSRPDPRPDPSNGAIGAARAPSPPAPSAATGRDGLVGREEDVAAVVSLVSAAPMVTLTGPGGVGKTRLAEAVGAASGPSFPDGVWVCPLAGVRDPDTLPVALIDTLGARHRGGRPATETVLAALGTRRLLLILDNGEHLLAALSDLVAAIVEHCPNITALTTSREPLRLPGEQVWRVAPLPVPRQGSGVEEVLHTPAGALFLVRARASEPTFSVTDDNAGAVGEVCRRLDGIPLAIELAAARVRAMTPADVLDRLDHRFSLLTGGPRRERGRHRTLSAVVTWSYDLLEEDEARLFDRLSVFAGPFSLTAAEQVCVGEPVTGEATAGLLAELVDKSMVVVDREDGRLRYRLLDSLREYGALRLAQDGDEGRYRRAHARSMVAWAEHHGPRVRGADEGGVLAEIDGLVDDLRTAHAWLVGAGEVDGALRLPVALRDYIGHQQRDEMITWTERALELPGAPSHPTYPAGLATAARGATRRGQLERARRYAEATLAATDAEPLPRVWALHALSTAALYEGRLGEALEPLDLADELAAELEDGYYRRTTSLLRLLIHLYRGEAATAATLAVELTAAAKRSGNQAMRAWALYGHGEALLDVDPAAAAPLLEQAIAAAGAIKSRTPEGAAMVSLASLCGRRGETGRALELFRRAVDHWRRLGDWTHQLTTLRNLVELLAVVDGDEAAARLHGAVTDRFPPSFGAEADRLASAGQELEGRLGRDRARRAAAAGRRWTDAEVVDAARQRLRGAASAP